MGRTMQFSDKLSRGYPSYDTNVQNGAPRLHQTVGGEVYGMLAKHAYDDVGVRDKGGGQRRLPGSRWQSSEVDQG